MTAREALEHRMAMYKQIAKEPKLPDRISPQIAADRADQIQVRLDHWLESDEETDKDI